MINTLEPSKALDSVYLAVFNQIKLASHQSGHDMDCRCCRVSWVEGNLFLLRHYHFTPRVRGDGALVQCRAAAADGVLRAISGPLQVRCRRRGGGRDDATIGTIITDYTAYPVPVQQLSSGHK